MEENVIPLAPTATRQIDGAELRHPQPFEQTQQFWDMLAAAHEHLLHRIEDCRIDIDAWAPDTVTRYVCEETANFVREWRLPVSDAQLHRVCGALVKELTGFGPLDDLLHDPAVEDILINGYQDLRVSRGGVLERAPPRFCDNRHLLRTVRRLLASLGRRLDASMPMADARLPGGGRLNAIIEPLAVDGPMVSIRKFHKTSFTPDELLARGSFDRPLHALLQAAVLGRCNILVCGLADSGKTSLLNALASFIPQDERVVIVEDTAELSLERPQVMRLERLGSFDGRGAVSARELVRSSLRMRPDRLLVGEMCGDEVLEVLQAMSTGQDGSMATFHADSPRDCLRRIEMLAGCAGFRGNEGGLRRQIAGAVDLVVQVSQASDGRRLVGSVAEIVGVHDDRIAIQEMFRHEPYLDREGLEHDRWVGSGLAPHSHKLEPFRQFLREAAGDAPR